MKRVERVYCELLEKILQDHINKTTQKQLSQDCDVSIGTVNYALKPLHQMGVIEKRQRSFKIVNPKKLLLYWASVRNITNEIIYATFSKENTRNIELMMPPCVFTAYSGYKYKFDDAPADYGEIYAYSDPALVKKRFPPGKSCSNNIFILGKDLFIEQRSEKGVAPLSLLYTDLWNLNTWYANEFLIELEKKLRL
jgi:DNA-binding transcriptional regulator YhcF (GntR family)